MDRPRVAVTFEQCWHAVPGGTAVAALASAGAVAALGEVGQVGVAAWHRRPPLVPWVPPVPVKHLRLPRAVLYESWHALRRPPVERSVGHVDVIHATGMAIPPRTAPLLVTLHDLAFLRWPEFSTRRGTRFFRRSLELTRRDADLVVCPSEATRRAAEDAGLEPERLRVVPWGVTQTRATQLDVERVRRARELPDQYVLWVGTIEPRKNLAALVEAFGRVGRPDLHLVLAGPDGWHDSLPPLSGLGDRVRTLGFVPPGDLPGLYAGARVFCYPSLAEGFGLPVLEAMAQGTPVVTSAGTATEEVLGGGGLAVDPRSVSELSAALAVVLEDSWATDEFGVQARRRAEEYTWERTARALTDLYKDLAA